MTAVVESTSYNCFQQLVGEGEGQPVESRSVLVADSTLLEPSPLVEPVSYRADGTVHIRSVAMVTGRPILVHLDDLILLVVKERDGTIAYYEVELPSA